MAEETDSARAPQRPLSDAAAFSALGAASRNEADAYLRKQRELADEQIALARLQAEELRREDGLRHWSLRVHHISDVMKLSFEFAIAVLLLGVVILVGSAVWSAAHDNGLVIEAFEVPPDMVQRGMSGQVVASQLLDRLIAMQRETISSRPAQSYANNWGNDIKVQIPDTGVSIGEFNRYLHAWLGHQTRISGEVYRTADGGIAVTARTSGDSGATVAGREVNIDSLMQQIALRIYKATQPYRYAIYEAEHGDTPELVSTLKNLSGAGHAPRDRAWAYIGLSVVDRVGGDISKSIDDDRKAFAILPNLAVGYDDLDIDSDTAGHEEESLSAARAAVRLMDDTRDVEELPEARAADLAVEKANIEFGVGDFGGARLAYESAARTDVGDLGVKDRLGSGLQITVFCLAGLHEIAAARDRLMRLPPPVDPAAAYERVVAGIELAYESGDWQAVFSAPNLDAAFAHAAGAVGPVEHVPSIFNARQGRAYTAYALAMTGKLPQAQVLIGRTPLDCDECVRIRGKIAALARDWNVAARWFAIVSSRSPDIPFADTDWGAMLLVKGDFEGAIAKFKIANQKGPHFADPLEMWGEALIAKNRSDLALAKFEEADKNAPNWGRLHLKWGEALFYMGKPEESKRQFAIAANLDLSPADKASFASWMKAHG